MDDDVGRCILHALLCDDDTEEGWDIRRGWRARGVCTLWCHEVDDRITSDFEAYTSAVGCVQRVYRRAYIVSRLRGVGGVHAPLRYTCSWCRQRKRELGNFSCCRVRCAHLRRVENYLVVCSLMTIWYATITCAFCSFVALGVSLVARRLERPPNR